MYISPFTYTVTYPKKQCQHMVQIKKKYSPILDENYPYREKTFSWKFKNFWLNILLNLAVIPVTNIRYAIRVEGRKNLRLYKKDLKKGFVSVSNHICEWDFLALLSAMYPKKAFFPIWSRNMETSMAPIFKTIGGIPVPLSARAAHQFIKAMDSVLEEKKWLHVYAEGSMWFFYPAVRQFQNGAFFFALRHNLPVLPLAISYREPKGIYKLFKKHPNLTVHIGKPLFPDPALKRKEAEIDLCSRVRKEVMLLMGIKSEEENESYMKLYSQEIPEA
ncbi:MAG: 1-acyl-sn-glycerol-3-phosphate acyltransferase [Treponema sp.]|nr:1-acyl-sn-glycerol-3-phosphate acyltransferase [Treponema sp.]